MHVFWALGAVEFKMLCAHILTRIALCVTLPFIPVPILNGLFSSLVKSVCLRNLRLGNVVG